MHKKTVIKAVATYLSIGLMLTLLAFNNIKMPTPTYAEEEVTRVEYIANDLMQVKEYNDVSLAWNDAINLSNGASEVKIILGQNYEHDRQLIVNANKRITLDLNGHYIKRNRNKEQINDGGVFLVQKDATFTVIDSRPNVISYDGVEGGVITGGSSGNGAGGIHIEENGHVIWQGGTLYECDTDYSGGGFYLAGSSDKTSLTMTGGKVYACQTIDSFDKCHGGAIYIETGTVNIDNATFDDCYSEDYGGAIYIDDGYLNVTNTLFASNYAYNYGGALYLAGDGLVNFRNCIFAGNKAGNDGGALYINNNPSTYKSNNYANLNYPATIFDGCTFRKNNANYGGAIYINDDNVALINATIIDNAAKYGGGGVWVDSLSNITFKGKCIVKDNVCNDDSAYRNVTLQKGIASTAYVYSAGLYAGSYIGINSSSGSSDVTLALKMSKYQMQYFHADEGALLLRDETEEEAPMVVTASLFGNGILWVSISIAVVAGIIVTIVLIYRKKRGVQPKVDMEE